MPPVTYRSLQGLRESVDKIRGTNFKTARAYGEGYLGSSSFPGWARNARRLLDPDKIRNSIYYVFQPAFDCLVDKSLDGAREDTVAVLEMVTQLGTEFLRGYYTGEPRPEVFRTALDKLDTKIGALERVPYKTKFRNVGFNQIYPSDIASFLANFLEAVAEGKIFYPDFLVGCACGSSEVAMPLAGLLGIDLGFIRRSKRRNDTQPKIIKEQEQAIKARSKGKVVGVEDFVCTGFSLYEVLKRVRSYGASDLMGASIKFSREGSYLKEEWRCENLHAFRLRD